MERRNSGLSADEELWQNMFDFLFSIGWYWLFIVWIVINIIHWYMDLPEVNEENYRELDYSRMLYKRILHKQVYRVKDLLVLIYLLPIYALYVVYRIIKLILISVFWFIKIIWKGIMGVLDMKIIHRKEER
ncbi:hypothetical protein A8L34_27715 [Bacillus sp. FJAT-27264]|uniref:hypothetical protein n=1 Tax=Paenibacillus sp. (strain DSM 101736 / FJAT-27264) TaxID=1850362 RepID=UPI000807AA39|nr:hypothetical protein [Bacillus sp. FJAT-27264]OBZ15839.1 hypothetical protein A8L34_27715 [Bacillus sp. FJAT-27264]